MRLKFMCAFTGTGHATPLVMVMSSSSENELIMTDKELKASNRMCVLKVESFSIHSSTDLLNASYGHAIFMQSSKNNECSADKGQYHWCNNNTYCNFANGMRKLKCAKWNEGCEIKPRIAIAGQKDGAIEQANNILTYDVANKDAKNRIIRT